jgi:hypothetical protein
MTIIDEVRDLAERARQLNAVKAHLLKHGSLGVKEARNTGVEGYGQIPHPAARICELRAEKWVIKTLTRPTEYKLISAPVGEQKQLTLV